MRALRRDRGYLACSRRTARRPQRCLWLFSALFVAVSTAAYFLFPPPSLDRSRSVSTLVLAADGLILRGFLSTDGKWRLPVEPNQVDPLYIRMLVAAEDARFAWHPGVDPIAVLRAAGQYAANGRAVSGASTLTMQVARLLNRHPRSLAAKAGEMAAALTLERRLSKDQVLALYLSLAPFGGNIEGVRAASLAYFGKEPMRLSAAECALLVAIPRSPERLRPDRRPEAARAARDRVLVRMAQVGVISPLAWAEAREEEVPHSRLAMPFRAPHLAEMLRHADPSAVVHRTTIEPLQQQKIEALLKRELAGFEPEARLAAVVVDNRSRRAIAYVGNADFASVARWGPSIWLARSDLRDRRSNHSSMRWRSTS